MNKISRFQFGSLMLINDVFVLFCLTGGISVMTAAGFGIGSLLQLLIVLPLASIYRKGKTLKDCGKFAELIALLGTAVWGGLLFSMLWNAGELVFVPFEGMGKTGRLLITGIIAVVCVYISSSGIKALARSAVIAAALGLVCLAIVVVCAVIRSDIGNLEAAEDTSGLFREVVKGFALSGGLSGTAVMLGFVKDNIRAAAVDYFVCKAVISSIVITTGVLVCGGIMEITDFPIVSAAQLSQPFPVQRIDSLFLIIFTVFAVYSIAVQASAAEYLIGELLPVIKKYRCSIMLAIMAGLGAVFGGKLHYGLPLAVVFAVSAAIIPLLYLIKKKVRA